MRGAVYHDVRELRMRAIALKTVISGGVLGMRGHENSARIELRPRFRTCSMASAWAASDHCCCLQRFMAPPFSRPTIMPVFSIRQAPSLKWMARTAEPCGVRALRDDGDAVVQEHARSARGGGVRATRCGIELPDAYALRLEARTHATARNPVDCPLEGSVLRQWCVRRQCGECPHQAKSAGPAFIREHI